MKPAYYNEIDKYAAAWLRNLIAAGHIAAGDVDERSIEDVSPDDLRPYGQCHWFAGIGVWSAALRLAGVPDDLPVWTGSCPCQPFSNAGTRGGFADERHLWPAWQWHIAERRPAIVLGEQVASKDANPWIDVVSTDLEGLGYAFGALAFPSAGFGAPHIRDRAYFVAHTDDARLEGWERDAQRAIERAARSSRLAFRMEHTRRDGWDAGRGDNGPDDGAITFAAGTTFGVAYSDNRQRQGLAVVGDAEPDGRDGGRPEVCGESEPRRDVCGLANADGGTCGQGRAIDGGRDPRGDAIARPGSGGSGLPDGMADASDIGLDGRRASETGDGGDAARLQLERLRDADGLAEHAGAGPTNGFWRDADWLFCRDEKWRPVEPGTFPLVNGAPARVGRLRAYGNAINRIAAAGFIESAFEAIEENHAGHRARTNDVISRILRGPDAAAHLQLTETEA